MNHYTYLLIDEELGMYYIGARSCKCDPMEDNYLGSSKHMNTECKNRCDKIVLGEFATRKEAIVDEIRMHELYDVARNKKFYNRAKQTSTGFDTCGTVPNFSTEHLQFMHELGKSWKGKKRSKEEIEKMRTSLTGRKLSEAHRKAISKGGKGRKFSEVHKQRIGDALSGRKATEETKAKIAAATKNRFKDPSNHPGSKQVINLDNGMVFKCTREADEWAGIKGGVKHVCRGARKSAGGYSWAYLENIKEVS